LVSRSSFWLVIVFVVLLAGGLVDYVYYRRRRHQAHAALTEAYSQAAVGQPATITDSTAVALEKLRAFITRELARGHTKEQIRAVLLKAGWQAKVVDEELARQ
jgi:cytochrome c-type biogenesis protein CcmH/NrfF